MSERRSNRKAVSIPQKPSAEQWVTQGREREARGDKAVKRLTLDIPEDLHRALKRLALDEDRTMLDLAREAIERLVEERREP
jgi:hypothetical protein